ERDAQGLRRRARRQGVDLQGRQTKTARAGRRHQAPIRDRSRWNGQRGAARHHAREQVQAAEAQPVPQQLHVRRKEAMTADDAYAKAVRTELDVKNMIVWLELEALKLGTDNQRERYSAGLLPEDELTALARTELFTGFAGLRRWAKRDHTALGEKLKHRISHAGAAC